LELDEKSGLWVDIGDKKASEKTSQALREGQTKIRKKLYHDEIELARSSALNPDASFSSHLHLQREVEISQEAYFGYSLQVLETLYIADETASDISMSSDNKMVVASAAAAAAIANNIGADIANPPPPKTPAQNAVLNQIAMMKALEQFPGLRQAQQVQQQAQNQHHQLMQAHHVQQQAQNQHHQLMQAHQVQQQAQNQHHQLMQGHQVQQQRQNQQHQLMQGHQVQQQPQNQQHQLTQTSLPASASTFANSVAVAKALEQFPGLAPLAQPAVPMQQMQYQNQEQQRQQMPSPLAMPSPLLPPASTYASIPGAAPHSQQDPPARLQQIQQMLMSPPPPRFAKRGFETSATAMTLDQLHVPGRYTNMPSTGISVAGIGGGGGGFCPSFGEARPTNLSLKSMFSIHSLRQLLETVRSREQNTQTNRSTMESRLSAEIRDLIKMSAPQLEQASNLAMDDSESHVGREIDSFYSLMEDRVSDLRFTDVTPDVSRSSAVGEAEYKPRLTDSTELSHVSKSSSMEASIRSGATEDMTIHSSPDCKRSKHNTQRRNADIASAELLLRLSSSDGSPAWREEAGR
jgi:hypothetical protein